MSRRRAATKREVLPDPIYNSEKISKFISIIMKDGKRSSAEKQFYGALDLIEKKGAHKFEGCQKSIDVFNLAVENVKPLLEVKSRRVGGSNYQVPIEVRDTRKQALAYRWIVEFSRKRSGRSMVERLASEIMDAAQKRGASIKRKEDIHKMAEANKAFAHFRW